MFSFGFVLRISVIQINAVCPTREKEIQKEMHMYSRSAIKPNPLLETYRVMLLVIGIATALALIGTVVTVIAIFSGGQAVHAVNMLIIDFPMFVLALVSFSLQYRYWKRIECRRLATAQENHAFLAKEQPAPDSAALHLPAAFQMSMSKVQVALMFTLLEIVIIVFSVYSWFIMDGMLFWLFLVGGTVLVLILTLLIAMTSRQVLEVTEVGLRLRASRLSGFRGMVRWNEARLFVVYYAFGARKSGAVLTYEFSSESSIIRWTRVLRPNSLGLHMDPGMPLAEHNQAMEALCQLIVAQTGLPLYDLREEHILENKKLA